MDVREAAVVETVQDPGGHRRPQVAVVPRHGAGLDAPFPPRPHDELVAAPKALHEEPQLAKVVGAVSIAHQHVCTTDERKSVDIGLAKTPPRNAQHAGAVSQSNLRCSIRRAVDDEHLTHHTSGLQPFDAPVHEITDRELLVARRYHNRQFRRCGVPAGEQQLLSFPILLDGWTGPCHLEPHRRSHRKPPEAQST
jgi:hypothetical protein